MMKNWITGLSFTAVALLCSGISMAQQQVADTKPKIANTKTATAEEKTAISTNGPQPNLEKKELTLPDQSKPIIPGGEFKPRDTRDIQYPVKTIEQSSKPAEAKITEMQAVPALPAPIKQESPAPAKQPVKPMQQVPGQ